MLIFLKDAVTLFYVTYVAAELPCSLVLKKFHPGMFGNLYATAHSADKSTGRMIPLLIFLWSVTLIGTGFMKNAGQLYASRLLIGTLRQRYLCFGLTLV
jgi:recombinational DNA repair protein (RecF pathway)